MRRISLALMMAAVVVAVLGTGVWLNTTPTVPTPGAGVSAITLRPGLEPDTRLTAHIETANMAKNARMYAELTGLEPWPDRRKLVERLDSFCEGRLARLGVYRPGPSLDTGLSLHRDGLRTALETKEALEEAFAKAGRQPIRRGRHHFELARQPIPPGKRPTR